jgi:hypothetical protein
VSIRGRALAQLLADAELSEKHFAWAAAGVQGYLDGRPPAAIAEIGPRVCEQITEWRKRVNEILAEIRGTAEGCRQRQIQLKAQAEWTPVMDVRQGDILFVESEGAWDRHDSWERPLVEDLPQCVLCRIGDGPTFFIGRGGGFVNSATGSLQVRANISVRSESTVTCRVLSVPVPDRQRTKFLQTSGGGARLGLNYEISPGHPDLQVAWHSPLHVNPCLDAGLGFDDRVIAIDDIPVDTRWDVQELLTRLHPGMEVSVTVVKRHSGDRDEANVVLR